MNAWRLAPCIVPDRRAKSQPPQIDTRRCLLMPRYTVLCQWSDSGSTVEDADEVIVVTATPAQAVAKAREKWLRTIGSQWPHCQLTEAFVLTPEKRAEFL